jgi:hypothetical protein
MKFIFLIFILLKLHLFGEEMYLGYIYKNSFLTYTVEDKQFNKLYDKEDFFTLNNEYSLYGLHIGHIHNWGKFRYGGILGGDSNLLLFKSYTDISLYGRFYEEKSIPYAGLSVSLINLKSEFAKEIDTWIVSSAFRTGLLFRYDSFQVGVGAEIGKPFGNFTYKNNIKQKYDFQFKKHNSIYFELNYLFFPEDAGEYWIEVGSYWTSKIKNGASWLKNLFE